MLRADAVEGGGADDKADIPLDDVNVAIDDADTVINCAGTTSDMFGVGTNSLTTFHLKVLLTMKKPIGVVPTAMSCSYSDLLNIAV